MMRAVLSLRPLRPVLLVGLGGALLSAVGLGCDGASTCTEIGCDHEAVVTFPAGAVSGPYDLVLQGEAETLSVRCLDPDQPLPADNPEGIACDASGFTLVGHPLANARTLRVSVLPADNDPVAEGVEVRLDAVDENRPNGPDCPPACFVRNGQLTLDT